MENPIVIAFAVFALLAAPGPTNALLAAAGASAGLHRSLHVLVAALAAYLVAIFTFGRVVASLLPENGRWALGLLAGAYLAILALRLWRATQQEGAANVSWHQVFVATLLNPKALALAFLAAPLQSHGAWLLVAGISAMVLLTGSVWMALGALLGRVGGPKVRAMVPKATSVALAVLAAVLIVSSLGY